MKRWERCSAWTAVLLCAALGACSQGAGGGGTFLGGQLKASTAALFGPDLRRSGGAFAAGGGYLVGAHLDKADDPRAGRAAARRARQYPAGPEQVFDARTADLNRDGFVSLDEIIALKNAGLSDAQMLEWLAMTGQVFELDAAQRRYLAERGVSEGVLTQMASLNAEQRERAARRRALRTASREASGG